MTLRGGPPQQLPGRQSGVPAHSGSVDRFAAQQRLQARD
jgi:hypothetical protein